MKIDHILYPVDFSNNSLALNPDVEWLAKHYDAQVTILNVFEVPTSWYGAPLMLTSETFAAYYKAEKERLTHYVLALPERQVQRISAGGNPAWNIAQWARDHKVDLIVMGTHGNGGFPKSLLGSVAMKVLHEVECPVWTYSARGTGGAKKPGISKILCAIQISKEAVPLLRFTRELARECSAEVIVVHSVPELQTRPEKYLALDFHQHLKDLDESEIGQFQTQAGTSFPVRITEKSIAEDVAEIALEQRADLIVTGRGVVQETFGTWRTHMCEIVRQAPCPVLSYPVHIEELELSTSDASEVEELALG